MSKMSNEKELHADGSASSNPSLPSNIIDTKSESHANPSGIPDHHQELAQQLAAMSPEEYLAFEKKVLKKMDWNIIPWITLLYLLSFLDRVNVGAARLVGMLTELQLNSLQYSNISMIFFVSYVAFEVPSNLVLKKFRPSRWIPFTMVVWGIFQTFMGCVNTYGQLLALRFCLGIFEAGLFPGLNFFLTGWYRREELNRRVSIFFAGAVLAGAFGGIFGYAIAQMSGVGGYSGWRWIFIIEGLLTIVIAVASLWMVHDWPDQAKFLTPLERECVLTRLRKDQGLAGEGKLNKKVVKRAFTDPKMYLLMLAYIGAAEPLYSNALFSPTIVATLGTFNATTSLLLSTPPYVLTFIATLSTAWISDRIKRRGVFNMFWSSIAMIGYILLIAIPTQYAGPRYFAVFLTVMSTGPLIACTISWTGNTWNSHYMKAICMGMVFSAGNSGGIVSSQAYRDTDSPRFIPGHATALAFLVMHFTTSGILWWMLARENKRRDEKYGPPPGRDEVHDFTDPAYIQRWGLEGMSKEEVIELGDLHPAYRYVL